MKNFNLMLLVALTILPSMSMARSTSASAAPVSLPADAPIIQKVCFPTKLGSKCAGKQVLCKNGKSIIAMPSFDKSACADSNCTETSLLTEHAAKHCAALGSTVSKISNIS